MGTQKLDNKKFVFTNISPLQLLEHLREGTDLVDAINTNLKLRDWDEANHFERDVILKLKIFFGLVDIKTDKLKEHNITTSYIYSKLEMCYVLQLKQCDSKIAWHRIIGVL